jgi:hypothetical protein
LAPEWTKDEEEDMTTIEPAVPGVAIAIDPKLMAPQRIRPWVTAAVASTIAGFALGLGFLLDNEGIFGPLSDLAAIAFAGTLLPVAWYLHRVLKAAAPMVSRSVLGVALVGLPLAVAAGAGLIVRGLLDASTGVPLLEAQHLGIFLQGAWMLGIGLLGLRQGRFRRRVSIGAVVGGLGYMIGAPVSLWMGFETPLFYLAFMAGLAGFLTWALSLRNDLIDDEGNTS